ncbi:hypothetical protein CPB86DRAFT_573496 [Serendipita vermifera]|nr:hypothetical protein CPB86DRAFT_573496 [Serendipita vermifera]
MCFYSCCCLAKPIPSTSPLFPWGFLYSRSRLLPSSFFFSWTLGRVHYSPLFQKTKFWFLLPFSDLLIKEKTRYAIQSQQGLPYHCGILKGFIWSPLWHGVMSRTPLREDSRQPHRGQLDYAHSSDPSIYSRDHSLTRSPLVQPPRYCETETEQNKIDLFSPFAVSLICCRCFGAGQATSHHGSFESDSEIEGKRLPLRHRFPIIFCVCCVLMIYGSLRGKRLLYFDLSVLLARFIPWVICSAHCRLSVATRHTTLPLVAVFRISRVQL